MAKDTHLLAIDLGEVLLSVDHARTYQLLGDFTGLSAQEVQRRLDDHPIIHALDRGESTPERFAGAVSKELDYPIDVETLRDCWTGILEIKLDVVLWLEAQLPNATCVLVSNINWWHWREACDLLPLLARLDAHLLSYVEGVRKPETEYYRRVHQRWPRAHTLFIDDRADNCAAAAENGFIAWRFSELPPLAAHFEAWLQR